MYRRLHSGYRKTLVPWLINVHTFTVKVHHSVHESPYYTTSTRCTRPWARECPAAHSTTEYGQLSEWATGSSSLAIQVGTSLIFNRLCMFVCLVGWLFIIHCPIENISLIWMRHHCLLRAEKLFCLVRTTLDQWGTFIVPSLLWHKASVFAVSFSHFVRQARGADDIPVMLCSKGIQVVTIIYSI